MMATEKQRLKSCPFCGSDARLKVIVRVEGPGYAVNCSRNKCHARMRIHSSLEDAIAAWNARSDAHLLRSHEATQAALKELEWIRDHVAEYGKNCNAPVVFSRASRALKAVDAALTEAAALEPQKEQL